MSTNFLEYFITYPLLIKFQIYIIYSLKTNFVEVQIQNKRKLNTRIQLIEYIYTSMNLFKIDVFYLVLSKLN